MMRLVALLWPALKKRRARYLRADRAGRIRMIHAAARGNPGAMLVLRSRRAERKIEDLLTRAVREEWTREEVAAFNAAAKLARNPAMTPREARKIVREYRRWIADMRQGRRPHTRARYRAARFVLKAEKNQ